MKNLHLTLPMALAVGLYGCATEGNTPGTTEFQLPVKARTSPQIQAKSPVQTNLALALDKAQELHKSQPKSHKLWQNIESNIGFAQQIDDGLVTEQLKRYTSNQKHFDRMLNQAALYLPYVLEQVLEAGMPAEIALIPFVESGYNPFAYSPNGAAGLWQLIPATGDSLGLQRNQWYDGRRDVVKSTASAIRYLQMLNKKFDGNWPLTLAAYNAGPSSVERTIKQSRFGTNTADFWSLPINDGTQRFVRRIVALSKVVTEPQKYGVELQPMPESSDFAVVELNTPVDLNQVARLANISTDRIYQLNPGFTRWATPPTGSHQLILPTAAALGFDAKLAALPAQERRAGNTYVVARGDNLSTIASKHNVSLRQLAAANNIKSGQILNIGQALNIPSSSSAITASTTSVFETYKVKSGDSLWKIAKSHNIGVKDILAWNSITQQTTLKPGQDLRIYKKANSSTTDYRVRSGDSLSSIAQRHNVKLQDLVSWNKLSTSTRLMPGQKLKILSYQ